MENRVTVQCRQQSILEKKKKRRYLQLKKTLLMCFITFPTCSLKVYQNYNTYIAIISFLCIPANLYVFQPQGKSEARVG